MCKIKQNETFKYKSLYFFENGFHLVNFYAEVTAWHCNVEQEHELLEYALTSCPSCGILDIQDTNRISLAESDIGGGGYLEDATHVIDDTDSDESVIESVIEE